ncbi:chromophore lyase CpcT/CpeT [cf. Phormidesmis sp. LEGE 11477]|uniref:chromophore lyase CpcT/CpeT n=1 Tax=cf. Phormidesmis sp. LEGE 11477 TaxID=1828680 RepID=UPI00187EE5B7|nr:chromophore lyase CpcT/CpeT [cf. Phormidesmis sp. LEGE 11477]MBE9059936.1 chromophore lyase CpcT/CpeT [cf. Phormidesmis sp. LEGE 11477]
MPSSPLTTLASYLAGEFENQRQAAAEPAWYVHLRLWQRPVPALSSRQRFTFLLEQQNVISGQPPYRQRILQITDAAEADQLKGQYFALKDPLKFKGAGRDAEVLKGISQQDLVTLPNSGVVIRYQVVSSGNQDGYQFQSALKDGELCSFDYGGQTRYVYLGFDVIPQGDTILLKTYDKGIDPDTGRGLWGALMGPFEMVKQASFEV